MLTGLTRLADKKKGERERERERLGERLLSVIDFLAPGWLD